MQKYLVEAIGSFFLLLTIGMSVLTPGAGAAAPVAIGLIYMVMVFAGLSISGGHYNPALSLAFGLRDKQPGLQLCGYWLSQIAGGLLAVVLILYFKRAPVPLPSSGALPVMLAEFIYTFALVYVLLSLSAPSQPQQLRAFLPLAAGATIIAGTYAMGAVSAAAFNPMVAIGLVAIGLLEIKALWPYLAAQLLAALAAWQISRFTAPK